MAQTTDAPQRPQRFKALDAQQSLGMALYSQDKQSNQRGSYLDLRV